MAALDPQLLNIADLRARARRRLPKGKSGRLRFRARLEPGFVMTIERP